MSSVTYHCWRCMSVVVSNPLEHCNICSRKLWRRYRDQLNSNWKSEKPTTEGTHEKYRAPAWLIEKNQYPQGKKLNHPPAQ